jgi:hypothetical protein
MKVEKEHFMQDLVMLGQVQGELSSAWGISVGSYGNSRIAYGMTLFHVTEDREPLWQNGLLTSRLSMPRTAIQRWNPQCAVNPLWRPWYDRGKGGLEDQQ